MGAQPCSWPRGSGPRAARRAGKSAACGAASAGARQPAECRHAACTTTNTGTQNPAPRFSHLSASSASACWAALRRSSSPSRYSRLRNLQARAGDDKGQPCVNWHVPPALQLAVLLQSSVPDGGCWPSSGGCCPSGRQQGCGHSALDGELASCLHPLALHAAPGCQPLPNSPLTSARNCCEQLQSCLCAFATMVAHSLKLDLGRCSASPRSPSLERECCGAWS